MSEQANPYRVGLEETGLIIVTTGPEVSGHSIHKYLGIVRGITVRTTSFGKGFIGGFKSLAGGHIKEYSEVCEAARHEAYTLMVQHAEEMGANAIVGMRYDATEFMGGATEVLAYGTAVHVVAD